MKISVASGNARRSSSTSNHVLTFIRSGADDEIRCSVTGDAAPSCCEIMDRGKGVDHVEPGRGEEGTCDLTRQIGWR